MKPLRCRVGAGVVVVLLMVILVTGGSAVMHAMSGSPDVDGTPPTPLAAPPAGATVSAAAFGAHPDDGVDDGPALQRALDGLSPGDTLLLPPGRYLQGGVLTARVPGTTISGAGATVVAIDEAHSALTLDADQITVVGLSLTVASTTKRWDTLEQHRIVLMPRRQIVLNRVTVAGSAASGIFVYGSVSFVLDHVRVSGTRADGIHMTGAARFGTVTDAQVTGTGDDGIAVVSYDGETPCHDIVVTRPRVGANSHGRGVSVVGGDSITWTDIQVERSSSAAVYIAVESGATDSTSTSRIRVDGARIVDANTDPGVDHGAVLIVSDRLGQTVRDVQLSDVAISGTRAGASQQVAVLRNRGTVEGVRLIGFTFSGSPSPEFSSNAGPGDYTRTGW